MKTGADMKVLASLLDALEPRILQMHCRVVPTSFDANDPELRALPLSPAPEWPSGERLLKHFASHGVMLRTPAYWQFGLSVHQACRAAGIPIFVNEPENIPVGAMALKRSGVNTVVCENKDAPALAGYLAQKTLTFPKLWILIHRADDPDWSVAANVEHSGIVAQEVHLFPGVPILEQCAALAEKKEADFHLSEEFEWENEEEHSYITGIGDKPFLLPRFRIPFQMRAGEVCTCGKTNFKRT